MEPIMKDNGKMIYSMGLVKKSGLMVPYMKGNIIKV